VGEYGTAAGYSVLNPVGWQGGRRVQAEMCGGVRVVRAVGTLPYRTGTAEPRSSVAVRQAEPNGSGVCVAA